MDGYHGDLILITVSIGLDGMATITTAEDSIHAADETQ